MYIQPTLWGTEDELTDKLNGQQTLFESGQFKETETDGHAILQPTEKPVQQPQTPPSKTKWYQSGQYE